MTKELHEKVFKILKEYKTKKPAAVRQREFKAVTQQKQKTQCIHCQNENKLRKCPRDTKLLQRQPANT